MAGFRLHRPSAQGVVVVGDTRKVAADEDRRDGISSHRTTFSRVLLQLLQRAATEKQKEPQTLALLPVLPALTSKPWEEEVSVELEQLRDAMTSKATKYNELQLALAAANAQREMEQTNFRTAEAERAELMVELERLADTSEEEKRVALEHARQEKEVS
jgi:hypothetical protein